MSAQVYKAIDSQHSGTIWPSGCCASPRTRQARLHAFIGSFRLRVNSLGKRIALRVRSIIITKMVLIRLLHTVVIHLVILGTTVLISTLCRFWWIKLTNRIMLDPVSKKGGVSHNSSTGAGDTSGNRFGETTSACTANSRGPFIGAISTCVANWPRVHRCWESQACNRARDHDQSENHGNAFKPHSVMGIRFGLITSAL